MKVDGARGLFVEVEPRGSVVYLRVGRDEVDSSEVYLTPDQARAVAAVLDASAGRAELVRNIPALLSNVPSR